MTIYMTIYIIILVIVFFIYGLLLSLFIDYLFPDLIDNQYEYIVFIETLFELGIVYSVYFFMRTYIKDFIDLFLFKHNITYLSEILLFAFSCGIYFYLKKYSTKIKYFQNKYILIPIKKNEYYKKIEKYYKNISYNIRM